jgi:hypothetical protein
MSSLLTLERIVLESLVKKEKSLLELVSDIGISESVMLRILDILMMKKIVVYKKSNYQINTANKEKWIDLGIFQDS